MSTRKLSAPRITGVISRAFRTIQRAGLATSTTCHSDVRRGRELKPEYDAVIVGAGHNGLITAAYLAKSGLKVAVLEKRHVIGGATVTEEIIPGYKFSRASYLLSLLRPQIYSDLELKKHGLKVYLRNPHSYTPLLNSNRSLLLGANQKTDYDQIAQFSVKDAKAYSKYESHLGKLSAAVEPLLDAQPISSEKLFNFSMIDKFRMLPSVAALVKSGRILGKDIPAFYELITAPGSKVLDRWFESEPLKATLGTDAVIGAMASPYSQGSGYVLLHHVMGELEGIKGAWGYPEGGMGGVSEAIASSARSHGADIFTNKPVAKVIVSNKKVEGVFLEDGTKVKAKMALCNPTPRVTYLDLLDQGTLPDSFRSEVSSIDYTSPVTKINVALDRLPNFKADPNNSDGTPRPHHRCTIHLNCETLGQIHEAYVDAMQGRPSKRPVIEMMLPSSLDPTLAPPGHHVCLLFTQYTPYHLADGKTWDTETKQQYANSVFDSIEGYAPGFKESIVGVDHLSPVDLEKTFGLTGGNIFHGSMSLDQLYFGRPVPTYCDTRCPVVGMYLCGSGAHPGGGVMGSPGRLAAVAALQDWKNKCL